MKPLLRAEILSLFCLLAVITHGRAQISNAEPAGVSQEAVDDLTDPLTADSITVSTNIDLQRLQLPNSDRRIENDADGHEGHFGRHRVNFSSRMSATRPVRVVTPDGKQAWFRPAFLAFYDSSTGKSVLLSDVKDGPGNTVVSNQVLYANVFGDLKADIRYHYAVNSLEQDILIRQRPPDPGSYGCNPDTTRMEMWTEWFEAEPQRIEHTRIPLRPGARGDAVTAEDISLDFGTMKIVQGKAFALDAPDDSIPVAKEWQNIGGRKFLIESVDYVSIKPQLETLPLTASVSPGRFYRDRAAMVHALADIQSAPAKKAKKLMAAATTERESAVVLDFTIVNSVPVPSGAISWWPAGGTANDAIGANNGMLMNGAGYGAGEVGQAFTVNGSGSYVKVPRSANLSITNQLTIEFWMKASPTNAMNTFQGLVTSDFYGVEISNGYGGPMGVNFFMSTTGGASWPMVSTANSGGAAVSANVWHHIAATYNGSYMRLYIDGQPWGNAYAWTGNISPMPTNGFLAIGSEDGRVTCGCTRYFNGLLDEVAIYNRALAASEILDIYTAGGAGKYNPNCVNPSTNAVGWWSGDGNAYDLAHTNFATWHGVVSNYSGRVSSAFSFNGSSYLEVPNNSDIAFTGPFSVEAWVNYSRITGSCGDMIVAKGIDAEAAVDWALAVSANARLRPHVRINGGWYNFDCATYLQPNAWYHVAMVYDGTALRGYVNGVQDGAYSVSGPVQSTTYSLRIGAYGPVNAGCSKSFFAGMIDELTLYNRALTSTEIGAIYSTGGAGKCKVDSDNDGLTDLQELYLADTDGDGILNWMDGNPNSAAIGALTITIDDPLNNSNIQ